MNKYKYKFVDVYENRLAQINAIFLRVSLIKVLPFCRVSLFATAAALFPVLPLGCKDTKT